jgi:hypothetical protein
MWSLFFVAHASLRRDLIRHRKSRERTSDAGTRLGRGAYWLSSVAPLCEETYLSHLPMPAESRTAWPRRYFLITTTGQLIGAAVCLPARQACPRYQARHMIYARSDGLWQPYN